MTMHMKFIKSFMRKLLLDKKYKYKRQKATAMGLAVIMGVTAAYPVVRLMYETTAVEAASYGIVTATRLNVRTGPGTNYSILQSNGNLVILDNGTRVTINSSSGNWYNVTFTYGGKSLTGYVCADYIAAGSSAASALTTGVVKADVLNVRTGPGIKYSRVTSAGKIVQLINGSKVTILSSQSGWYYITFSYLGKTLTGYVSADYITLDSAAASLSITSTQTTPGAIYAQVNATNLNVRTSGGTSSPILKISGKNVMLPNNTTVRILAEQTVSNAKWYKIKFTYNGTIQYGFVHGNYLKFTIPSTGINAKSSLTDTVTVKKSTTSTPLTISGKNVTLPKATGIVITEQKVVNGTNWMKILFTCNGQTQTGYLKASETKLVFTSSTTAATTAPATTAPATTAPATTAPATTAPATTAPATTTTSPGNTSEDQFEKNLQAQGFPADYITALTKLHREHPNWVFKAYNTGLDWNTAITKESAAGINLIPGTKNVAWKSLLTNAYVWKEDRFVVYDNPNWVTASQSVVAYYMDPRNFLDETYIFMFENLSYDKDNQTQEGVEAILKGTPMYKKYVSYVDSSTGKTVQKLYSQIFMEAAQYSGVSPYHLASRCKQEIVTSATSLSSSASGTVEGYTGLYNYYNIGATNSTLALGAIRNGLSYAKNGTSSAGKNALYMIPWTTPYKAIVGGAYFIGSSYIAVGQNTIYLEKFNVTGTSTYAHQYMGNVQAAYAEAAKVYTAYTAMDDYDNMSIVFSIPVYKNMPAAVSALPADTKNPNNWLSSLSVSGYTLTPTFDVSKDQEYTLTVPSTVSSITINASAVSSLATVSGAGKKSISTGINVINVTVTAENGDKRVYKLNVVRKS